ncbi:MAG: type II toxin-antitoxin system Phd/YefM family antitoxin [Chloroflexi bacterium]|nr:type II toxin-antitoxin system Phd/YefM family antitoxin [Chloroflexota bacterium]
MDQMESQGESGVRTFTASEFKAKCLKIMDEVAETGERVVITKRGKPVAEVLPARARRKSMFGAMRGMITYKGDIISPVDVEWDAMKDE